MLELGRDSRAFFTCAACSTPFGILYVGTRGHELTSISAVCAQRLSASYMLELYHSALPPLSLRGAQRLSASYMLELPAFRRGWYQQLVLNAFRHLICWNVARLSQLVRGLACSTPFGILYVGTNRNGSTDRCNIVLNAFRHLICWNTDKTVRTGCCTATTSAQRLSASYMLERSVPSVVDAMP